MTRDRRMLRMFRPVSLVALLAAAPPPLATPGARQYAIAGITAGMPLAAAIAQMHQTFVQEGLTDLHAVSVNAQLADGGRIRRLTIDQSASSPPVGEQYYREDRFKLRLAGPPGDERVTAVTRDYLAPVGLARRGVIEHLEKNFGQPSTTNIPQGEVAPNSAMLTWMAGPGGQRLGGGSQGATELTCGGGMRDYFDAFDNAGDNDNAVLRLLQAQHRRGCSLMVQVSVAYDAVHFEMYDALAAMNALGGLAAKQPSPPAAETAAHVPAAKEANTKIRY